MADGVEKKGLNSELVIMKHMEEISNCTVR
jgi:hypothetical protein